MGGRETINRLNMLLVLPIMTLAVLRTAAMQDDESCEGRARNRTGSAPGEVSQGPAQLRQIP